MAVLSRFSDDNKSTKRIFGPSLQVLKAQYGKGYTHVTMIKYNIKLIKIRIIICNRLFEVGIASNRYLLSNGEFNLEIVQTACQGKKIIINKLEK